MAHLVPCQILPPQWSLYKHTAIDAIGSSTGEKIIRKAKDTLTALLSSVPSDDTNRHQVELSNDRRRVKVEWRLTQSQVK